MALGYNKNRDVLEVFNDRWKANHNYNEISQERQRQSDFNRQMFGNSAKKINPYSSLKHYTSCDKLNEMNNKINTNQSINTESNVRNILNGFKK